MEPVFDQNLGIHPSNSDGQMSRCSAPGWAGSLILDSVEVRRWDWVKLWCSWVDLYLGWLIDHLDSAEVKK